VSGQHDGIRRQRTTGRKIGCGRLFDHQFSAGAGRPLAADSPHSIRQWLVIEYQQANLLPCERRLNGRRRRGLAATTCQQREIRRKHKCEL
jgi:hypothetical protein